MAKNFNTIFAKIQPVYGYQEALNLIAHDLRIGNANKFKNRNEKYFNPENSKNNLYIDASLARMEKQNLFDKAKRTLDQQIDTLRSEHEFRNYGHHSIDLEKLKKQVIGANFNLFYKNKNSYLNQLDKVENHKDLKKWIKDNDEISFEWFNGLVPSKQISWEEFLNGYGMRKVDDGWEKVQKRFNKKEFNFETGEFEQGLIKKPSFVSNLQIQASREWFEQMEWVEYKKQAVFQINPKTGMKMFAMENTGIKEIKMPEELARWVEKNTELVNERLKAICGHTDNLLAVSMHVDESKPHLNFELSNIYRRDYYYEKDEKGNLKAVEYFKALERIANGEELVKKEKTKIITSFEDERLKSLINNKSYSLDYLHPMHVKEFDANIKEYGYAQKYYGKMNYVSMDQYKSFTDIRNISFNKDNNLEEVLERIEAQQSQNDYLRGVFKKEADSFKEIMKAIYERLERDISANLDDLRVKMMKEAHITDKGYLEILIEQIKDNLRFREKDRNKGR